MKLTESRNVFKRILGEDIEKRKFKFKSFMDVAKAAEKAYEAEPDSGEMEITKTPYGFSYVDLEGDEIKVFVKGDKASIKGGEQNMSIEDFANLISGDDIESLF